MTDTLDRKARSELMSRVRQKHTEPEMAVRRSLHAEGLRYVLHPADLPGKPDLLFPKYGAAVFVHGCFWHGHDCRAGRTPSTNSAFWQLKIDRNRERDARKTGELEARGWRVFTVWECETKRCDFDRRMSLIASSIKTTVDPIRKGPKRSR
ncbi:very short patch repair endonuclease [Rhizobacter fulvus]